MQLVCVLYIRHRERLHREMQRSHLTAKKQKKRKKEKKHRGRERRGGGEGNGRAVKERVQQTAVT